MSKSFDDYINALTAPIFRPRIKLEFLNPDQTPFSNVTNSLSNSSGNLSVNYQTFGIRRSLDVTLNAPNIEYYISPDSIWLGNKIKLYLGLEFDDGETYFISQGIFCIENPSVLSKQSERTISFTASDKYSLIDGTLGGELTKIIIYQVGDNITVADMVRDLLLWGNDIIEPLIDEYYENITIPYNFQFDIGTTIGDALGSLCKSFTANAFYDRNGVFVFTRGLNTLNDTLKGSVWSFKVTEQEYLSSKVDYPFSNVFNQIKVIGDNINNANYVEATAINDNPESGTNIYRNPIRQRVITDSQIVTQDQAQEKADYELNINTMIAVSCNIQSTPFYHADVSDVVDLSDAFQRFDATRLFVKTMSIPLQIGSEMSTTSTNVNELKFGS